MPLSIPPGNGWLRTIRETLGFSRRTIAERLAVTPAAVRDYEDAERRGAISLATLRRVADALGCDVVLTVVPKHDSLLQGRGPAAPEAATPAAPAARWNEARADDEELEAHLK